MARARNIKPGFFKNEDLAEMDMATRLLFIGLWTLADKEGRLEYRPKRIKAEVFPYEDVDAEAAIDALAADEFLCVYQVGRKRYIQVNNWKKHQSPHHKEADSEIPGPENAEESTANACMDEASPVHDPSMNQPSANENASCPTDSLIPDSHDSLNRIPEGDISPPPRMSCPYQRIVEVYHEILTPPCPAVEKLTDTRKGLMRQRWAEDLPDLDHWRNYFEYVAQSDFLMGRVEPRQGRPPFVADLEWLCRPSNYAKVAEDKYHRGVA